MSEADPRPDPPEYQRERVWGSYFRPSLPQFHFPDCIEIASEAGIEGVVQPGGSIKDDLSIESCNQRDMSMYLTGTRHFYH